MSLRPIHNPPENEPLLTYKEAGKLLGVTDRTIWTLVNDGQLPAVRFGRSNVRIDPADLRAFIASSKVTRPGPGSGPGQQGGQHDSH